jgi:anti-sigma B factor antagonist
VVRPVIAFPARISPDGGADLVLTDISLDSDRVRVAFTGEIDMSSASAFAATIVEVIQTYPHERVYVDLAGVRFLDSSGIRALLAGRSRAHEQERRLFVVGAGPIPRQTMEITRVVDLLTDPDEANAPAAPRREDNRLSRRLFGTE